MKRGLKVPLRDDSWHLLHPSLNEKRIERPQSDPLPAKRKEIPSMKRGLKEIDKGASGETVLYASMKRGLKAVYFICPASSALPRLNEKRIERGGYSPLVISVPNVPQ